MESTKAGTSTIMTPCTSKGFRTFPPETREMIFKLCLGWHGKTPTLLAALRCDKELYFEAIYLFYKAENAYYLSNRNNWSFYDMSKTALKSVKKVKVEIDQSNYAPISLITNPSIMSIEFTVARCPNLRDITFESNAYVFDMRSLVYWPDELEPFTHFKSLCKVLIDFPIQKILVQEDGLVEVVTLTWDMLMGMPGVTDETKMAVINKPEKNIWRLIRVWEAKETFVVAKTESMKKASQYHESG